MLEVEIKALKEEISALKSVVAELVSVMRDNCTQSPTTVVEVAQVVKPEGTQPEEKEHNVEQRVSRDDLQALCTEIMRKDRSKKDAIKEAIASFDGATNLIKVADSDLAALHTKLSALI